ncbi:predicted protein [Methanosarcina acetivorans C2A]|uniref:Transposase n=1 Tax=Methanosarcina acetivorans (strain ATCC 35395 / DSM 2834 / JCM 12185 / C2A) TaxID=188937 RepID=Q8TN34_METAC|nr:predicted protein [Methanosarcina acetivorans C2A]
MSFVGAAKANQTEELLDVPLSKYECLYKNSKGNKIFGYGTKHQFCGTEYTTVITYNEGTYKLQKSPYETNKSRIIDSLEEFRKRLESSKGKERNRSSVEHDLEGIILKKYSSIIKYEIIDALEGKKKPQLKFWIDEENEKKCERTFGKNILFTDKHKWQTKEIVKTYSSKNLVEDDFKLLNDHLLVPTCLFL